MTDHARIQNVFVQNLHSKVRCHKVINLRIKVFKKNTHTHSVTFWVILATKRKDMNKKSSFMWITECMTDNCIESKCIHMYCKNNESFSGFVCVCVMSACMCVRTHTHTHTYIYIYIQRERKKKNLCMSVCACACMYVCVCVCERAEWLSNILSLQKFACQP